MGISLQALENQSTATRIQVNPLELGRSVDFDVRPRTAGDWKGYQFSGGEMMSRFGDGTDHASIDKLGEILGHTGPPVPNLEEQESTLAAWVSRAQGSIKGFPEEQTR